MESSKSDANWLNFATSLYCARSNLIAPVTFLIAFVCAAVPTLLTESPMLIAGLIPWKNKSVSRKICPSVMEITFVAM